MMPNIKYKLIKNFLIENGYENLFVEFTDKFVIKKHNNIKAVIGMSAADYPLDEFIKAMRKEDESYLIDFLDDINGTVTQYADGDDLMRENDSWMVVVLNSESKEFLSPAYALEEFDNHAYDIHEFVLDIFWWHRRSDMINELEEAAADLVDIYHYKGENWYITPGVYYKNIRLPYIDDNEKEIYGVIDLEFAYFDIGEKTKKAAKQCLKILQRYKREMELESIPYFVNYYLKNDYGIDTDEDEIMNFIENGEYERLIEKLDHQALAKIFAEKYQKENYE